SSDLTVFLLSVPPSGKEMPFVVIIIFTVNTFFYPYSRFVYEGVYDFILGNNAFYGNAFFMLFMKIITMSLCWSLAIVIAPIGLMYLYYRHSKTER
ncbi:MAG: hypothetical protein QM500_14635, partial [Methylococcales bacterium]